MVVQADFPHSHSAALQPGPQAVNPVFRQAVVHLLWVDAHCGVDIGISACQAHGSGAAADAGAHVQDTAHPCLGEHLPQQLGPVLVKGGVFIVGVGIIDKIGMFHGHSFLLSGGQQESVDYRT